MRTELTELLLLLAYFHLHLFDLPVQLAFIVCLSQMVIVNHLRGILFEPIIYLLSLIQLFLYNS